MNETTAFYTRCQDDARTQDAADNAAQMLEREEAFGITIPGFASELASGFRRTTVEPTDNVTTIGQ